MPLVDFNLKHEPETLTANSFKRHMQPHRNDTDSTNFDPNVNLSKRKFKRSVQKYSEAIYYYLYKRSIRKPILLTSNMSKKYEVDYI